MNPQLWLLCHLALACVLALAAVSPVQGKEQPPGPINETRDVFIWQTTPGANYFLVSNPYEEFSLSFAKTRGDPLDDFHVIRPIKLVWYINATTQQEEVVFVVPSIDGLTENHLAARTSGRLVELLVLPPYHEASWEVGESVTDRWRVDRTLQPDGTESVRFFTYNPNSLVPFNLAKISSTNLLVLTAATHYLKMIDADKYPYSSDWTAKLKGGANSVDDNPKNACHRTVKTEAWQNSNCGVSLTDTCQPPALMDEGDWATWKQSVRSLSPECSDLMDHLELCCREYSSYGLTLIPVDFFMTALSACVEEDIAYVAPGVGETRPQAITQRFDVRALCSRMMFSQTAIRPYLMPIHGCLLEFMNSWEDGNGYFEPEAYFHDMCVRRSSEFRQFIVQDEDFITLQTQGFLSFGSDSDDPTEETSGSGSGSGSGSLWTNDDGWTCVTGSNRCYKRFLNAEGIYRHQAGYRSSCPGEGGRLATFRTEGEMNAISAACSTDNDGDSWYEAGCWIDGVTVDGYNYDVALQKTGWQWGMSGAISDANTYLITSNFWENGRPTGRWWDNQQLPNNGLQVLLNGNLSDYPNQGELAGICSWTNGTTTTGTSTNGTSTTGASTNGTSTTNGTSPSGDQMARLCPSGGYMADPVGTGPARCYVRVNNNPDGPQWSDYISVCAALNGSLASFRSQSEFAAIGLACSVYGPDYYAAGCWLGGVTNEGYNPSSPSKTAWHWSTPGGDSNDFLVGSDSTANFWSPGEPSGMWNGQQERCLQVFTNGQLNDYPCYGGLAAVCMMDSIPAS